MLDLLAVKPILLYLFYNHASNVILLLFVYVDDVIVTGNNHDLIHRLIIHLSKDFNLKDLGPLCYFLVLEVQYFHGGLILFQTKYGIDFLIKSGMINSSKINTSITIEPNPFHDDIDPTDATGYCKLCGSL